MSNVVEFINVGKQYRLGRIGTGTLQHDLNRWWQTTIMRKPDPYLIVGEPNDRSVKGKSDFVWALKDISFSVEEGDVVGIIGKNGAGKSTLLKLLSHITAPSTGKIYHNGHIASLLEVGTGFHPEMTARENIFMNGSIMGMTRHEIKSKLDEIVDFAGIERYLETPVKRFSSGMTVRLGFAVAAFLEPEILVVDEVLAVGDAEFQKKAIGKMKEVSEGGGRTVLFVSHNMAAVKNLCNSGVVLKDGLIDYIGTAEECVNRYINENISKYVDHSVIERKHRTLYCLREIEYIEVNMQNDVTAIATDEPLDIVLKMRRNNPKIKECQYTFFIEDEAGQRVMQYVTDRISVPMDRDVFDIQFLLYNHDLTKGQYVMCMEVGIKDLSQSVTNYDQVNQVLSFCVKHISQSGRKEYSIFHRSWGGYIIHNHEHITANHMSY